MPAVIGGCLQRLRNVATCCFGRLLGPLRQGVERSVGLGSFLETSDELVHVFGFGERNPQVLEPCLGQREPLLGLLVRVNGWCARHELRDLFVRR